MPTDDNDFAHELPSPTAVRAAYRNSPMVVGMLGMRNSLIPALHSLEPWQRLSLALHSPRPSVHLAIHGFEASNFFSL